MNGSFDTSNETVCAHMQPGILSPKRACTKNTIDIGRNSSQLTALGAKREPAINIRFLVVSFTVGIDENKIEIGWVRGKLQVPLLFLIYVIFTCFGEKWKFDCQRVLYNSMGF